MNLTRLEVDEMQGDEQMGRKTLYYYCSQAHAFLAGSLFSGGVA